MPTPAKMDQVAELKEKIERCSIAVTTNYAGITVNDMTDLRKRMRGAGVEFVVIKNTLINLAAEAAQHPQLKDIVSGPTAVAFGYDDPAEVAKSLNEYIRVTRSPLAIQGAIMGEGPAMAAAEVNRLATLPSKPQLVANLMGQLQAPLQRLLSVLHRQSAGSRRGCPRRRIWPETRQNCPRS